MKLRLRRSFRPPGGLVALFVAAWLGMSSPYAAPPANDRFESRITIVGPESTVHGNVAEATAEPGEPAPSHSAGHSLWWTWTPAEDGLLRLGGQGVISVFRGDTLDSLQELWTQSFFPPRQPGGGIIVGPNIDPDAWIYDLIPVTAGVAYKFRLDSNECTFRLPTPPPPLGGPIIPGSFPCQAIGTNLWLQFTAYPAASDSFAGRRDASSTEALFFARNDQATLEPGEPVTLTGAGRSVWWSWTVPATGRYTMELAGNLALSAAVYRGEQINQLERVTERRVAPLILYAWGVPPRPKFFARAGERLALRGDALPGAPTNALLAFRFHLLTRPVNDDLANALVLTNLTDTITAYGEAEFAGATAEPGESPTAVRSAWWRWMAPGTGNWAAGPGLSIFLGDHITNLTAVELSRETSVPRLAAEAGRTYLISLDALDGEEDALRLRFRLVRVPGNDDRVNPLDLSLGSEPVRLSLTGTSVTPAEPWATNGFNRSVWLRWRAPAHGYLVLRPLTAFKTKLVVGTETDFTGSTLAWANSFFWVPATFPVISGTTYLISVLTGPDHSNDEIELAADFTSRHVARPTDGAVFPSGTSNLVAELAPAAGPGEPAIIGVNWQLSSGVDYPRTGQPISEDLATWSNLPSGLWNLTATLTNEYQRTLQLPPVTVRLPSRNDNLADAIRITEFPWTSSVVSTAGAGSEPDEPAGLGAAPTNSVWWTWTPHFDGVVVAYGSGFQGGGASVAVFEGSTMPALKHVHSSAFSPLRVAVQAGSTLSFQVTPNRVQGLWEDWRVQLALLPQLPGDDFAWRTELPPTGGVFQLPVGPSTTEPDEPLAGANSVTASLWWTWTPPADGTLILRGQVQQRGYYTFIPYWRAFTGATLDTLTHLPAVALESWDVQDPITAFRVQAGEPVQIAGSMWGGTNAATEARLEFVPDPTPGTVGRTVRTTPFFGPAITFPVKATAEEQVIVEVSTDLARWSQIHTQNFQELGTVWLGPFYTYGEVSFFRVRWQPMPQ